MKILYLLAIFSLSTVAEPAIEIVGNVNDSVEAVIVQEFNDGASLYYEHLFVKKLPENLGSKIFKITEKNAIFTIYFKEKINEPGFQKVKGKYFCPNFKCYFGLYEPLYVRY
ncbi:hypothetical protein SHLI107390_20925 [Shewanella livingstonensis]|uniref:Uncharacterized protein n=1 Tax=Shewanella livingstonensis TaxID=150120 RepID=A0A3G8LWI8_9GAMM|nr:hypothetical protein [Shewanella livingstonensis]AZG73525.1 hypothetical protein EGC82_12595 [Shewanella livingstonensis]